MGNGEASTRRQAAADVLQALVGSGYRTETTEIVGTWIQTGLEAYRSDPKANWTAKDSAEYLLGAVATEASTMQVSLSNRYLVIADACASTALRRSMLKLT